MKGYLLILPLTLSLCCCYPVDAWCNGGYSDDLMNYGTHDWIAQHTFDLLSTRQSVRAIVTVGLL